MDVTNELDVLRANVGNRISFNYNYNADIYSDHSGLLLKLLPNIDEPTLLVLQGDTNTRVFEIPKIQNISSAELK